MGLHSLVRMIGLYGQYLSLPSPQIWYGSREGGVLTPLVEQYYGPLGCEKLQFPGEANRLTLLSLLSSISKSLFFPLLKSNN